MDCALWQGSVLHMAPTAPSSLQPPVSWAPSASPLGSQILPPHPPQPLSTPTPLPRPIGDMTDACFNVDANTEPSWARPNPLGGLIITARNSGGVNDVWGWSSGLSSFFFFFFCQPRVGTVCDLSLGCYIENAVNASSNRMHEFTKLP